MKKGMDSLTLGAWRRSATWVALLFALLHGVSAHALPWYVSDTEEETALRGVIEVLWPEGQVDIVVGDPEAEGFELREGALILRLDGEEHTRPVGGDLRTAVALARSWLRELDATDGWVPKPDNYLPPVAPEPEPLAAPELPATETETAVLSRDALHMSVGIQDLLGTTAPMDGLHVAAGATEGHATGEVSVYITTGGAGARIEPLDGLLASLGSSSQRSYADLLSVSAGGRLYGGPAEPQRGLSGGPTLYAGLELRSFVERDIVANADGQITITLSPNSQRLDLGPVFGVGLDVWVGAHAAFRLSMLDRVRIRPQLVQSPIIQEATVIYEIVYRP